MRKILYITAIIFLFSSSLKAQDERDIWSRKGKVALNSGDSTLALECYLKAIELKPFTPFDHLKAISLLTQKDDYVIAVELIKDVLSMGYHFESIEKKQLHGLKNSTHWSSLQLVKDSIRDTYEKSIDQEYVKLLENMVYMDQEIRKPYMKSLQDSLLKEKTLFAMELVDSLNFNNLMRQTKSKGFPNYNSVGYLGVNNAWLILWHHRGEYETNPNWQEIKPYIEKEIAEGKLPKDFLAMFLDYNEIEHDRPIIYGTIYGYYRGQPEYDKLKVINRETLNQRRAEIGLAPIELWLKSMNLPMPKTLN